MTPKQKRYLQWLLTQTSERDPKTAADLAAALECRLSTLRRWSNDSNFQDAFSKEVRHQLELNIFPVCLALVQNALEGDFRSIKLFLELLGVYPSLKESPTSIEKEPLVYTINDYVESEKRTQEWYQKEFGHLDPSQWSKKSSNS